MHIGSFKCGPVSIGKWKFHFNLKLKNIFNLYNESGGEIVVVEESFHLLGARIEYQATDFLRIYLSGHNLLNQEYFPTADKKAALAPGRAAALRLSWNSTGRAMPTTPRRMAACCPTGG